MFTKIRQKIKIRKLKKKGVQIGEGTIILSKINCFSSEAYLISIGEHCLISGGVMFSPHDGGVWTLNKIYGTDYDKIAPIVIGNNVYIGYGAIILGGTTVGDNTIIGADAVVLGNIPSNSVVCGVPAKAICSLEEYKKKNEKKFDPTVNMSPKEKRLYFQAKLAKKNTK